MIAKPWEAYIYTENLKNYNLTTKQKHQIFELERKANIKLKKILKEDIFDRRRCA